MCGSSNVAGASGGGSPAQVIQQTSVAGAAGAAPGKVAGDSGPGKDATQVGGAADAAKGATQVAGGGGGDLASILKTLAEAIKSLADVVSKMNVSGGGGMAGCPHMGGKVAGVQGEGATKKQFVAKVQPTVVSRKDEDHAFEQRVLELINVERAKAGLAAVAYNGTLDNAAEKHASHMASVGKMAHQGIGDGDPGARARAEGWRKSWGENVATGQTSPEQVVREWMNSPTHRKNIMDPSFRNMGVGYVTAANGRSYWAQEFGA